MSSEISVLIEKCVIASAWVKPESHITDTVEVYKIENSQSPFGFLNGVYRTRLSGDCVDRIIQDHFLSFKDRQISFRWYSFPHSTPRDLDSRLMAFHPSSVTELSGLFCRVAEFHLDAVPDVTVEELTFANVDDYCRASNEGWGQSGAAADKIVADTKRGLENGDVGHRAYLARYRGEPASTGLLRIVDGAGYLLGGSTSPRFRQKGVYSALVRHRMNELKNLNISLALILARKATSAPICMKLGFSVGCECRSFDFNF